MGIDQKSFAEQRTHDADGHDFTVQERRTAPRTFGTDEEILDHVYRTCEAAQLSKRIGGHYKCAYHSAAVLINSLIDRGYRNPRARKGRVPIAHVFPVRKSEDER